MSRMYHEPEPDSKPKPRPVRFPKYKEILKTSPRKVMNSLDRLFGHKMIRKKFEVWD